MSLYGFFLDSKDALRRTNAGGGGGDTDSKNLHEQAMRTPYHYYENQTFDKSAKDPWRPWTYKFHNFELEHAKFRQLENACWLEIVTDGP